MTLTFGTHKLHVLILADCVYQLLYHRVVRLQVSEKSIILTLSYTKAWRTKFDLAVK